MSTKYFDSAFVENESVRDEVQTVDAIFFFFLGLVQLNRKDHQNHNKMEKK